MPAMVIFPLWAVHLSDGVLKWPWLVGGFIVAALLAMIGAWRIRDEEIPQTALLTAAFFVASLIHVSIPPTSVHLLLNGLVGVVLGRRAGLAIMVGLFLQAALFQHGGFTTLGINTCIMALPALLGWQLFALLRRLPWARQPWFRLSLVAVSVMAWILSLAYGMALFFTPSLAQLSLTFHLTTLAVAFLLAGMAALAERRLENRPEFPIGLLVGEVTVLATIVLLCFVLMEGGQDPQPGRELQLMGERLGIQGGEAQTQTTASQDLNAWRLVALVTFVLHLPIAVVEGIVLGFTVGFLARVKPEMLGHIVAEKTECLADSLS